jgi:hypothetical protein
MWLSGGSCGAARTTRSGGRTPSREPTVTWRIFARRRGTFDRVSVQAPWVEVDTTDGYKPELDDIVRFVNSPQANE